MAIPALDNAQFTPTTKISENIEKNFGACDSCGMKASYEARKDNLRLILCGHHARKNAASLLDRGFVISPDDYSFTS